LLLPLVIAAIAFTVALWPKTPTQSAEAGDAAPLVNATVNAVNRVLCEGDATAGFCRDVVTLITSGPDKGQTVTLSMPEGPDQQILNRGDKIILGRTPEPASYSFADYQRGQGLFILGALFSVLVVALARWRGLGALVAVVITWVVIVQFVLPSILEGHSPIAVALAGASLIAVTGLYVSHGFNARTTTAAIGTLAGLAAVGGLTLAGVEVAHLTGASSQRAASLPGIAGQVDVQGLFLGGVVIGAIGAISNLTLSQASSVWQIHASLPALNRRRLYVSAMRAGRDQMASTVYMLVLAYTGAALPLLILFTLADRSLAGATTSAVVAEELVRALVGGIGLVLSMPVTTALAAIAAKGEPSATLDDKLAETSPDAGPVSETTDADELSVLTEALDNWTDVGAQVPPQAKSPTTSGPAADAAVRSSGEDKPDRRKRRFSLRRRRSTVFGDRRMTRRERRFWEDDA